MKHNISNDLEKLAEDYDDSYYDNLTQILDEIIQGIKDNKIICDLNYPNYKINGDFYDSYEKIYINYSRGELIDYYDIDIDEDIREQIDDKLYQEFTDYLKYNNYDLDLEKIYKDNSWEELEGRSDINVDVLKEIITNYIRLRSLE